MVTSVCSVDESVTPVNQSMSLSIQSSDQNQMWPSTKHWLLNAVCTPVKCRKSPVGGHWTVSDHSGRMTHNVRKHTSALQRPNVCERVQAKKRVPVKITRVYRPSLGSVRVKITLYAKTILLSVHRSDNHKSSTHLLTHKHICSVQTMKSVRRDTHVGIREGVYPG